MAAHAQVRKEALTTFNRHNNLISEEERKIAHYPIQIVCNFDGDRWVINSRFTTTNVNMECPVFTDKDKDDIENMENSLALRKLLKEIDMYADEHPRLTHKQLRNDIYRIIKGEDFAYAEESIIAYIKNKIVPTKRTKSTREKYVTTCKHISDFDDSVNFDSMTPQWLAKFEKYMRDSGKKDNTINIQMRNLRATFNIAIVNRDTERENPFTRFKMPKANRNTQLLRLSAQDFADFRDYPVPPVLQRFKDFALLSFYLGGMNPCDIISLRKLNKGRVVIMRQKTNKPIDIPVCEEAMEIINKYRGDKYLVNFGTEGEKDTFMRDCDHRLKQIGIRNIVPDKRGVLRQYEYIPLFPDITLYTFRRSFATIAAELDIPTENIAMTFGHATPSLFAITEVYIVRSKKKTDDCINKVMQHLRTLKGRSKEEIDKELMDNK